MSRYTHASGTAIRASAPANTKYRIVDSMFGSNLGNYVIALQYKTLQSDEALAIVDEAFIQQSTHLPQWHNWEEDAKIQFMSGRDQHQEFYMHFSKLFSTHTELAVWKNGCTSHSASEAYLLTPDETDSAVLYGTAPF